MFKKHFHAWTRRLLCAIFAMTLLIQTPAYAIQADYYVFLSDALYDNGLPGGTVSYGFNDYPLVPAHDDACGVLIEDVGNISWYFYEYNSSSPIDSFYHGGDVIVFLPLPGCDNNGSARINIDGQDIFPPDGAADYILLYDGASFRSVDMHGNLIVPTGGGHVNAAADDIAIYEEPLWESISSSFLKIKQQLLDGDPQSTVGTLLTNVKGLTNKLLQSGASAHSIGQRHTALGQNMKTNQQLIANLLDRSLAQIELCADEYYGGLLDKAYVACDQAQIYYHHTEKRLKLYGGK